MAHILLAITGISLALSGCGKVQTTNSNPISGDELNTPENDEFNIVGGSNAAAQPFFASLRSDNSPGGQWCGGTFIADRIVLTAAHCLEGMLVRNLHVAVGETRNLANETTTRRAKVRRVIIHPEYNPETLKNDIALLLLDQSERSKLGVMKVMPLNPDAGLPERLGAALTTVAGAVNHISAYGFGNTTSYGFLPAVVLQQAKLKSIPAATCRTAEGLGDLSSSQLCAGFFYAGGVDTCQGDSGGPLVLTQGKKQSLVGLTSFGQGCAEPKNPGVYTRVSSFKPWIEQKINEKERVDINSPRDPNRYAEVKDVVSQRCFSDENRTNFEVFNGDFSQAFMSIAPRYNKAAVFLSNESPNQPFASSCSSQFEIPSDLSKSTLKIDLSVGFAEQTKDGTYSSRVRLAGQDFKLEKIPADVVFGVSCKENEATGRAIKLISEGGMGLLALGNKYFVGSVTPGVESAGSVIASCTVLGNMNTGQSSAKVEIRSTVRSASPVFGESVYASLVIKDNLGREHRFGLMGEELGGESEFSGLDSASALVQMSAALRPNRQTYSLKLQNMGRAPVINWELQCNAAFSARLRAQVGTLSPVRNSALISNEILNLTGATDRAGWHSLGYLPVATTPAIPGMNGRIDAGKTVEMLVTVHPSLVSSFACSLNNEEITVLSDPLPVMSQNLIAQRFLGKKAHRFSSGRSKLTKILGLKD